MICFCNAVMLTLMWSFIIAYPFVIAFAIWRILVDRRRARYMRMKRERLL